MALHATTENVAPPSLPARCAILIMNAQRNRTQHTVVAERRGAPDVVERRVDGDEVVERRVERRDGPL